LLAKGFRFDRPLALTLLKAGCRMKKPTSDTRILVKRKHLEVYRQENRQYEQLLKLLNTAGTAADRLRQTLDEVDRSSSVTIEIRKARELIEAVEADAAKAGKTNADASPARYETNLAAVKASNAKLLEAVQQRARENQLLVCRALAMMQAVINMVGASKTAADNNFSQGVAEAA
jgi:hypothetical protein